MPNPIERLGYIKNYSSLFPDLFKTLAILSDAIVRISAVDREDVKPYWKSEKRPHFSNQQSYYLQVFQRLH